MDITNLSIEELDRLAGSLWRSMMTVAQRINGDPITCIVGSLAEHHDALMLLGKILFARAEAHRPSTKSERGSSSKYDHSDDAFSYVKRNDVPPPDALEEPVLRSRKKV